MTALSGIITKLMQVAEKTPISVSFDDIAALAERDRQAVDQLIRDSLESDVALVSQVSQYIVMSGGKRLRPLIVLLAARALGYEGDQHVRAATIIEFINAIVIIISVIDIIINIIIVIVINNIIITRIVINIIICIR